VAQKGQIDSSELGYYEAVIWLTGAQRESTLTSDDQAHLIGFLDGGGQLFLTGQNIGDEIGLGKFFSDYLRVGHLADTVQNFPPVVAGVAGDLIGDGAQLFLWGSNGPVPSPSAAEALEGANEVLFYQNDSQQRAAATRYESPQGYRVVYFGFGYETIRTAGAYTPGRQVLERILNWFGLETGPTEISPQVPETQPSGYALLKNYPNPFNTTTGIAYQLPGEAESQRTTLRVYNILGQEVRTLVDEIQGAGKYQVWWDGRDHSGVEVETGIYFYLLSSGAFRQLGKMVLLK
jgi:hypothetical protein